MEGMRQPCAVLWRRCGEQRLRDCMSSEQARAHGRTGPAFEGRGIDGFKGEDFDKINDVPPPGLPVPDIQPVHSGQAIA